MAKISFSHYDIRRKNSRGKWITVTDKHKLEVVRKRNGESVKTGRVISITSVETGRTLYGSNVKLLPRYTRDR